MDFDYKEYKRKKELYEMQQREYIIRVSQGLKMQAVCQKASVSYSTYKGYKGARQKMSLEKVERLVETIRSLAVPNKYLSEQEKREYLRDSIPYINMKLMCQIGEVSYQTYKAYNMNKLIMDIDKVDKIIKAIDGFLSQ